MRAVVQRVHRASVAVDGKVISQIGPGLVTLLGIAKGDSEETLKKTIDKICDLRIFEDDAHKMNLSLKDIQGEHLIVSQFTLIGDCRKGKRPSFFEAEVPEKAKPLYEQALSLSQARGVPTQGGQFQADMKVELVNDGPVTLVIEF